MGKNVTAPRRWQYKPDTEPTQLAYVTQPEIDLLVDANIHGSMDGQPNRGPKGIISLDSGGDWSKPSKSKSTSKPSGGGGKMRSDDPRGERGQSTTKKEVKKVQKAVKEAAKEDRTAQAYVDRWDEDIRSTKAAEEFKPTDTQLKD